LKIIGIHDGHNSSVALFDDNSIVYALSEERLTRIKNKGGIPINALRRLLDDMGLKPSDVDFIAMSGTSPPRPEWVERDLIMNRYKHQAGRIKGCNVNPIRLIKSIYKLISTFKNKYTSNTHKKLEDNRVKEIYDIGFTNSQIKLVDHHQCHASASIFSSGNIENNTLILTNDGGGDGLCATASIVKDGQILRIAKIPQHDSFASLFSRATFNMGLVPLEHEYKVMGMAPYGDPDRSSLIYKQLVQMFEWPDNKLIWRRSNNEKPTYLWGSKLENIFRFKRFDDISRAMQDFIEFMALTWVKNCLKETGANNLVLGGGLFMNVKLNKRILELDEVDKLFVMPSCSDESNSIGAAYQVASELLQKKADISPLNDLYLGAIYSKDSMQSAINNFDFGDNEILINEYDDIESVIASIIADGGIIARYWGREEFGARALGNRSILSDPRKLENIVKINKMIKQRDFWMPFAGSMREEDAEKNLYNPKKHLSSYMIITFETNNSVENYRAATHPYDSTIRPQVVKKNQNPNYYKILQKFYEITGSDGGLLNTSFNLHGYPIVSSPQDALTVFYKSGLKFLALDRFILTKK
jgi:carbamoyltransferase